jgi:hypothetical protein
MSNTDQQQAQTQYTPEPTQDQAMLVDASNQLAAHIEKAIAGPLSDTEWAYANTLSWTIDALSSMEVLSTGLEVKKISKEMVKMAGEISQIKTQLDVLGGIMNLLARNVKILVTNKDSEKEKQKEGGELTTHVPTTN